jgi:hypothetical protein
MTHAAVYGARTWLARVHLNGVETARDAEERSPRFSRENIMACQESGLSGNRD